MNLIKTKKELMKNFSSKAKTVKELNNSDVKDFGKEFLEFRSNPYVVSALVALGVVTVVTVLAVNYKKKPDCVCGDGAHKKCQCHKK